MPPVGHEDYPVRLCATAASSVQQEGIGKKASATASVNCVSEDHFNNNVSCDEEYGSLLMATITAKGDKRQ